MWDRDRGCVTMSQASAAAGRWRLVQGEAWWRLAQGEAGQGPSR